MNLLQKGTFQGTFAWTPVNATCKLLQHSLPKLQEPGTFIKWEESTYHKGRGIFNSYYCWDCFFPVGQNGRRWMESYISQKVPLCWRSLMTILCLDKYSPFLLLIVLFFCMCVSYVQYHLITIFMRTLSREHQH